ncbi:hypothetical protein H9W90_01970 [Polaribacter pectinis]|uniref:Ribosome maturation factor RimP C-terminal domain-containing protein n=1 Tax=Polaribacter pectinis TaxID=2738844 RepID=A0A7G9LBB2_9FLAO|nr:hypothetical protein [Polaribacter pectinis]QNM85911.1 hypothetical protein H9W90_01970 [Polaribacter pectinis]
MKKAICVLSILILFQSCYSYKTFDLKDYKTLKPKKVKIELLDSKEIKGKIVEFKNDRIVVESSKKIIEINTSKIKNIQKRKSNLIQSVISISVGAYLLSIILESLFKSLIKGAFKGFKFPA